MANKNIPDIFNEVAKAIQKKTGETKAVDPNDFGQKIEDIPQEVIVHGDMDDAFDEAKGDAIWEDGYFLGYYNSVTKEVKIDLEPIMIIDDSDPADPASWIPAIYSSGSVSAHDVGIQEITADETRLAELNAYDIYFAQDSEYPNLSREYPNLSRDQFIGIELNMGSESSEEFKPTGKIVNGIYKKYTEKDLYVVTSSGTDWALSSITEDGGVYMTTSSGSVHYYKMRFANQESDDTISSQATIYKYLGFGSSEPKNYTLYNVGTTNGIYTIDTNDSDLMYSSYHGGSDLPSDGDLLKVVMSSNKIELVDQQINTNSLYLCEDTSNENTSRTLTEVTLPSTQGATATITIDGYSYTITNNGPVE